MTKKEIIEKIEYIENMQFYLKMKDFWNFSDYQKDRKMSYEIKQLKEKLATM